MKHRPKYLPEHEHNRLLAEIDAFLEETSLSESYVSRKAFGRSTRIFELRHGGKRATPLHRDRFRAFCLEREARSF